MDPERAKRGGTFSVGKGAICIGARLMLTVSVEAQSVHATRVSGASGRLRITSRAWRAPLNHRPQRGQRDRLQVRCRVRGDGGSVLHAGAYKAVNPE